MNDVIIGQVSDIGHRGRAASAVWIREGIIHAVGGDDVVTRARRHGANVHDRRGSFISPGFVDPHAHVEAYAVACTTTLDLRFPQVRSIADVLRRLRQAAGKGDGWIIAQANLFWDRKLDERRYPTRGELDAVAGDRPIAIRAGGHVSILNSRALELADLGSFSAENGMMGRAVVERDAAGEMTGLIAELDALLPVPELDAPALERAVTRTMYEEFVRRGVTTVGEIVESRGGGRVVGDLGRRGELPMRVFQHLWVPGAFELGEIDEVLDSGELSGGLAHTAAVKVFADGGFSSRNAAVLTPYLGDGAATESPTGDLNLDPAQIDELLTFCAERGLQLAEHTNGERAQQMVLDAALQWAMHAGRPAADVLRLEHAGNLMTSAATLQRLRSVGARIVTQPTFVYTFSGLLPEILGAPAQHGRHSYRRLIDAGVEPAASSDIHMGAEPTQMDPFFGMWCATARRTFDNSVLEPEQAVTRREALAMYTLFAARALRMGDRLGSITPGKEADLAICSGDPSTVASDELRDLSVQEVWVGGQVVVADATRAIA